MSLQDMKKLPHLSPKELVASLTTLNQDLDQKLADLYTAKDYINRKMKYIEEYQKLSVNQYQKESPDYNNIYLFSIDDTEAWSIYIKDQYQSILFYNIEKGSIETGLAIPTSENHPKLWEYNKHSNHLSFILKVAYSNPSTEDFQPHIDYLNQSGYHVINIFARYLFSACEGSYYDYYKAFAEVSY